MTRRRCENRLFVCLFSGLLVVAIGARTHADITTVTEVGLGTDAPAIIATGFGEDALTFSDRTHQHNGAAFDGAGLLSTSGTNIVPLPSYLLGADFVQFANNARDNAGYSATVTTDTPSLFYVLVDNRANGPAMNTSSPNTTDPVLGGALQWVIDGGWVRVNTGISPNGQADYTGVDEGGDGVGPGVGLNQFYSVYVTPGPSLSATVGNILAGGNMVAVVAVAEPVPEVPSLSAWGLVAMMALLTGAGALLLGRRRAAFATARI